MFIHKEDQHKSLRRTIATIIVVTLLPAVILSCFILTSRPSPSFLFSILYFVLLLNTNIIVSAIHMIVLGIPAILIGMWLKVINWWSCTITGFMIGAVPQLISSWQSLSSFGWSDFLPVAIPGAIGGFVFWFLWRYWVQDAEPKIDSETTHPNNSL